MTEVTISWPDGALVGTELGDGPVALLLHAGGEHRGVWTNVAEGLVRGGYRTLAWDLRGHGESAAGNADQLPLFADDVAVMISALDVMPVVVGASLGGLAALLALRRDHVRAKVAGLVLVDVIPDPDPRRVRAFLTGTIGGLASRPLVSDILDRAEELRGAAGALDLPTLLVRGGNHSPLTDVDVNRFMTLASCARVSVIEGAGHLIAQDAPAELAGQIEDQLSNPEVRRRRIGRLLAPMEGAPPHHPAGSVVEHLERTGDTLETWGAPDWVIDAGRLHAIYGTDGFQHTLDPPSRQLVRATVGTRAEQLIDLYCRCDRTKSYLTFLTSSPAIIDRLTSEPQPLTDTLIRGFVELTVANELDVLTRDAALATAHGSSLAALSGSWHQLLSEPARAALAAWPGGPCN